MPEHEGRAFAGVAVAAVYLLVEGADALVLAQATADRHERRGLAQRYDLAGGSPVADAFRTGRALWRPAADPADSGSLGVLPLGAGGSRRGCLAVVDDSPEGFCQERRVLLELYAECVAARLGAGGARGQEPASGQVLGGVGAFGLELRSGRVEADAALLGLAGIDPEAFDGRVDTLLGRAVPDDLPALMSVVEPRHQAVGVREVEFRMRRDGAEPRWLSMHYEILDGAVDEPRRMLGVVAESARLRPRVDDVSVVQRLSAALANAHTVRDVGRLLVATLREPLGADRLAVAEVSGERLVVGVLVPPERAAWPGVWQAEWRTEWPDLPVAALPTVRAALRAGRPGLWPDGTDGLEPGLAEAGPGALAVLPLPGEDRRAGVCLIGWDTPHAFDAEERSLLTAAGSLAGQALVRARAFDAQHELATMLQRSLLPRALPELPGAVAVARYLPATAGLEVGGDWYDVIPLSEGHVGLVVGDVQGHDAGAATLMGQIRTAIRAYAVEGHPPDVVVSHANRLLLGMETDLFATCLYVDLNLEDGSCWLVRAGHPQPLLRHPDGGTEEVAVEGGPPLGVLADAEYVMGTADLSPGTVLVLLTDGLVESAELVFDDGVLRLRRALARIDPADPGRAADLLLAGVRRGHGRADDMVLLLLRYDGMRDKPIRAGATVWRLPDAVMHARRYAKRTLRAWGLGEESDEVLLIVSELVTNALVHTQGPVRFDLTLSGDRLRVAVSDSSPRTPVKPASLDWEATGGRGLLLVEAMAASWGSVPLSGGKQVWGEVAVAPRRPAAEQAAGRPGGAYETPEP